MKKMTIGKKATLGIGLLLFFAIGTLLVNIRAVQQQTDKIEASLKEIEALSKQIQVVHELSSEVAKTNLAYMDAIVDKNSLQVEQGLIDQHNRFYQWVVDNQTKYLSFIPKEDLAEAKEMFEKVPPLKKAGETLFSNVYNKASEEKFAELDDVIDGSFDFIQKVNTKVLGHLNENLLNFEKNALTAAHSSDMLQYFSVGILIILGFAIAFVLISSIKHDLKKLTQRLHETAMQLGSEAQIIKASSEDLSKVSTEQAASLQETASAIDEISAMVNRNAESASTSAQVSEKSAKASYRGRETVESMVESIKDISSSNEEVMEEIKQSNKNISEIVTVISEIGEKTKVINDIVFQTKLLSFNASVEAARAGEHGKGFAVVAEEVGNLASMSGKAATEITEMLDRSTKRVTDIVENTKVKVEQLMRVSKDKIEVGIKTTHECGEALDEISKNVETVNSMVREISTASNEQASGVSEVTKAMNRLDEITHQNTAAAGQSSMMATKLEKQSQLLSSVISDLSQLVGVKSETVSQRVSSETSESATYKLESKPNIVSIHHKSHGNRQAQHTKMKKASGESFPSADDDRFEDI